MRIPVPDLAPAQLYGKNSKGNTAGLSPPYLLLHPTITSILAALLATNTFSTCFNTAAN